MVEVLAFGTYDSARHPRMGVLLSGLRSTGISVWECNEPLRLSTAQRVRILRQFWRLPLLVAEVLRSWMVLMRRSRGLPAPGIVLVGYLAHFDVLLARVLFRHAVIGMDLLVLASDTARDRRAGRAREWVLGWLDAAAIASSDLLIVDTEEHQQALPPHRVDDSVVVRVGAQAEWIGPEPSPRGGPLRVVFFGLYTPLQGAPVIGAAIAELADGIDVTMIGSGQDFEATRAATKGRDVAWIPWVAPEELPAVVASHDVCLGIFSATGKGTRVVPNKVYQGSAAGCAIVTSDTPPQRRVLGNSAVFVQPGEPEALSEALRTLRDDREQLLTLRRAAWHLAKRNFTPEAVVAPLVEFLRTGLAS